MLVFDCETHLIRPGLLTPPLVCVSYAKAFNDYRLELAGPGADIVEAALDRGQVVVGHNIAFDLAVLATHRPSLVPKVFRAYREGRVRDTQVRQLLLDIAAGCLFKPRPDGTKGYNLAVLEKHYFGRDRSEEKNDPNSWRMRYAELDGVPIAQWPAEAVQYALDDTEGTWRVFSIQDERRGGFHSGAALALLQSRGWPLPPAWDFEAPLVNEVEQVYAAWCLHLQSVHGVRTNGVSVDRLEKDCTERFTALQEKMLALELVKIRKAKSDELAEGKVDFWRDGVGYRYQKNTAVIKDRVVQAYAAANQDVPRTDPTESAPQGNIRINADTLAQSGDPLLEELADGGPLTTILKTFVPTLKRGTTTPINARFNVLVETGRPSCADPNLYNIPRKGGVRECFEARPGNVFCSVDFDCAELRSLAQVCLWLFGKSALAEFFQKNPDGDPHLEFAAYLLNISPEEALYRKKLKCGSVEVAGRCLHCQIKDMRQMCKAFNFGLMGGMGPDAMVEYARASYGVRITRMQAYDGKKAWLQRWPEMQLYFDYISRLVGLGDATVMQMRPGGLPHRQRGGVGYCDGCNGFVQGLTADGAKEALCLVTEEAYTDITSALFQATTRPVIFLYDEIIAEMLEHSASPAAFRMAELMRVGMQKWLPDIPVTCAPALMRVWSKEAETVMKDGVLVPWEPTERAAA